MVRRLGRLFATACWIGALPIGVAAKEIPRSVLPGIDATASRTPVDVNALPWRGIGVLQTELGMHCTGALIGPRAVLTAAHCLVGLTTQRFVQAGSIHFLLGYARGEYAAHARGLSYVTGRVDSVGTEGRNVVLPPDADWAVVILASPIGTADRILPLRRSAPPPGAALALGGYEQDRLHMMVADLNCSLLGTARDSAGHSMLSHNCAGTRGASGGPLLEQVAGGTWSVIGVVASARVGAAGGYAVPIAAVDPAVLDAVTGTAP